MAKGSWTGYAAARSQYLALLAIERVAGRTKYIDGIRRELAACRHTHYAKAGSRQHRYNRQFV